MTSRLGRRAAPAARAARGAAAGALMALAVTVTVARPTPARAQGNPTGPAPAPAPAPASQIRMASQSTWVGDGGTFRIGVTVTTPDPAGARLQLSVYRALSSRSDFTESLADRIHTGQLHAFDPVPLASLGPSPELSVAVNPKASAHVAPALRLLASGVYPVRVDLYDAGGSLLSRLTTHLVYSTPDASTTTRLDVAWVAPFHAPPPTGANGGVSSDDLSGLISLSGELTAHPNVPLTVAATPQTVESLANGAPGERPTTAQLAQALATGTRELVAAPYVRLDLPSMLAAGLDSEISTQLSTGTGILAAALHAVPTSALWIASGPLSPAAVDELAGRGVRRIITTDNTLSPLPAEDRVRTLAQPFTVLGKSARVAGAAVDDALAAHFANTADQLLAAHQLLADLALIQLEVPNRRGGRGVVIVPPAGWQPDAAFLATFLDGLGRAPTLAPVTVDRLFSDVTPLQDSQGTLVRTIAAPDKQPRGQTITDAAIVRAARHTAASLAAVVPPSVAVITEIERHVLISESADIADRARPAEAAAATRLIDQLKSMVRLPGNQSITFTARQGLIPITILSSAPYPLRVRLRVSSQKLGFRPVGLPGGNCTESATSEVCTVDLKAQNTTVRVPVVARTAGVFSLTVALDSPDGALTLATSQDTVRSTAASGVGVFLSVGAALLLAVWWVRNVLHGRRARRLVPRPVGGSGGGASVARSQGGPPPGRSGPRPAALARLPAASWDDQSGRTTQPVQIAPIENAFSRNTAVMAVGTLLSRLTGFGRVLALIWAFGIATGVTDVYIVANTAPNILYDLVLGGILSATLVPVFVDLLNRDDPDEGWQAISAVVTAVTVTLVGLTAVFWLLAPAIIRFYLVLDHSANVGDARAIGTSLLHMFVPQLFLLGGIAVTTALLNARRHFAVSAFSPVVNNLVAIGAIVAARLVATSITLPGFRADQSALLILGLGTTAGYLFQFLVQLPPLWRAGFRLRPVWDLTHPAVRTVLRLSVWTFGSVMANQISFNLILVLADHKKGDVAVFTTAYQFFQLPYAIFAVSIASVITPDLSEHWAKRDLSGFRRQMAAGLRLTMAVMVPAAVGYVVLAQPFLRLIFRHGSFSAGDAHRFGTVVALFAVGLPGFSAYLLLMRAYQAMQDTRSMFWLYLLENVATLVLAGALYPLLGVGGLALGWVAAYTVGSVVAFAHLRRRTQGLDGPAIVGGLVRVGAATAIMVLPVLAVTHLVKGHSDVILGAKVLAGVVAGAAAYLAAARAFGVTELTTLAFNGRLGGGVRRAPR